VKVPEVHRGDVYLVNLNPTRDQEIRKLRPCLVVSPNELNDNIQTIIVAPLTKGSHAYPFRIPCCFQGQSGHIILDQIRTVDRERLVRHLGTVSPQVLQRSLLVLQEMFAP